MSVLKVEYLTLLRFFRQGARQYTIGFSNNYLIRGVIKSLREEGFIPEQLEKPYA